MNNPSWRQFEKDIALALERGHPAATVRHNVRLPGLRSGVPRQVDILLEESRGAVTFTTAVEAKDHRRPLDVKHVEEFIGMLGDIGVSRGMMISPIGYTAAAFARAFRDDVDLDLDILSADEFLRLQSPGAIIHRDAHGAVVPAPFGWVIDPERPQDTLGLLYRRGQTQEQAFSIPEFAYIDIAPRDELRPDIESLLALQQRGLISTDPNASISVHEYMYETTTAL
jgi:hypothetical protein